MEMVRRAHELGYLVGSCSDRALSSQEIAIVLAPDYIDSPVVSRMYNRLAEDLVDFTSQIPLVVLNSLDGTRFSYGSLENAPFRR